jgi:hypothetical protein
MLREQSHGPHNHNHSEQGTRFHFYRYLADRISYTIIYNRQRNGEYDATNNVGPVLATGLSGEVDMTISTTAAATATTTTLETTNIANSRGDVATTTHPQNNDTATESVETKRSQKFNRRMLFLSCNPFCASMDHNKNITSFLMEIYFFLLNPCFFVLLHYDGSVN